MTESMGNRISHDPVSGELDDEVPVSSEPREGDNLETAQEAEELDQDPDAVPNRVQDPQPPRPERVGPWDDDDLED